MDFFVKLLTGYTCRTCRAEFSGDDFVMDAMKHLINNPTHVLDPHYTYVPSIELFILVALVLVGISIFIYHACHQETFGPAVVKGAPVDNTNNSSIEKNNEDVPKGGLSGR